MAGKHCAVSGDISASKSKNARAFCEGRSYRATDTALNAPVTDNPHDATSEAGVAWIAGWNDAEAGAGTYVGEQGCCAALGDVLV